VHEACAYCSRVNAFVPSIPKRLRASQSGLIRRASVIMRNVKRLGTALALVAISMVAGCAAEPSEALGPASSDVQASGVPATAACPAIDLRMPDGQSVDLTGDWQGDDFGTYYFSQVHSCLHWLGQSNVPPEEPTGAGWTNVFTGRIAPDFTVEGPWSDLPYGFNADLQEGEVLNSGDLKLEIDFFEADGITRPTLHLLEEATRFGLGGWNFVPMDALDPRAEYTGTYGFDAENDCPWLDLNGRRYELIQWQWGIAEGGQLLGERGALVARPGDQIRVDGQIAAALRPQGCQADAMLAWDLAPAR
jgi:hypothetical protein